jgi:uncharacterized protein YcfL
MKNLSAGLLISILSVVVVGCNASKAGSQPASDSVVITPDTSNVEVSHTQQFNANMPVTWGASNGTMSSTGLYTAPGAAMTDMVTATSTANPSETGSANVTVTPPPEVSINIVSGNTVLPPGQTVQFAATVTGEPNTNVVWTSSAGSISANGLYTAPSVPNGTVETVTATSADDQTVFASTSVTITTLPVIEASISPATISSGCSCTITISWRAYNALGVSITPGNGGGIIGEPLTGSQQYAGIAGNDWPASFYTVTAFSATSETSVNVFVTVTP